MLQSISKIHFEALKRQKDEKDLSRKVYFISTRNVYIYIEVFFKVSKTQIDRTVIEVLYYINYFFLKKPQNVLREILFANKREK